MTRYLARGSGDKQRKAPGQLVVAAMPRSLDLTRSPRYREALATTSEDLPMQLAALELIRPIRSPWMVPQGRLGRS